MIKSILSDLLSNDVLNQVISNPFSVTSRLSESLYFQNRDMKSLIFKSFFIDETREDYAVDRHNLTVIQEAVNHQIIARATDTISELTQKINTISMSLGLKNITGSLTKSDIEVYRDVFKSYSRNVGYSDVKNDILDFKSTVDNLVSVLESIEIVRAKISSLSMRSEEYLDSVKSNTGLSDVLRSISDIKRSIQLHDEFIDTYHVGGILSVVGSGNSSNEFKSNFVKFSEKLGKFSLFGDVATPFRSDMSKIMDFINKFGDLLGESVSPVDTKFSGKPKTLLTILNNLCRSSADSSRGSARVDQLNIELKSLKDRYKNLDRNDGQSISIGTQISGLEKEIRTISDSLVYQGKVIRDIEDSYLSNIPLINGYTQEEIWENILGFVDALTNIVSRVKVSRDLYADSLAKYESSLKESNPLYSLTNEMSSHRKELEGLVKKVQYSLTIVNAKSSVSKYAVSFTSETDGRLKLGKVLFSIDGSPSSIDDVTVSLKSHPLYTGNFDSLSSRNPDSYMNMIDSLNSFSGRLSDSGKSLFGLLENFSSSQLMSLSDMFEFIYRRNYLVRQRSLSLNGESTSDLSLNLNRMYKTVLSKTSGAHKIYSDNDIYVKSFYDTVLGINDSSEDGNSVLTERVNSLSSIMGFMEDLNSKIGGISQYFAAKDKIEECRGYWEDTSSFLDAVKEYSKEATDGMLLEDFKGQITQVYDMAALLPNVVFNPSDPLNPIIEDKDLMSLKVEFANIMVEIASAPKYQSIFNIKNKDGIQKIREKIDAIKKKMAEVAQKQDALRRTEENIEKLKALKSESDTGNAEDKSIKSSKIISKEDSNPIALAKKSADSLKLKIDALEKEIEVLISEKKALEKQVGGVGLVDINLTLDADTKLARDLFADIFDKVVERQQYKHLKTLVSIDKDKADSFVGLLRSFNGIADKANSDASVMSDFMRVLSHSGTYKTAFAKFKDVMPYFGIASNGFDEKFNVNSRILEIIAADSLESYPNLTWLLRDKVMKKDVGFGNVSVSRRFSSIANSYYRFVANAATEVVAGGVLEDPSMVEKVSAIYNSFGNQMAMLQSSNFAVNSEEVSSKLSSVDSAYNKKLDLLENGGIGSVVDSGEMPDSFGILNSKGLSWIRNKISELRVDKKSVDWLLSSAVKDSDKDLTLDDINLPEEDMIMGKIDMIKSKTVDQVVDEYNKGIESYKSQIEGLRLKYRTIQESELLPLLRRKENLTLEKQETRARTPERKKLTTELAEVSAQISDLRLSGIDVTKEIKSIEDKISMLQASHADNIAVMGNPVASLKDMEDKLSALRSNKRTIFDKYLSGKDFNGARSVSISLGNEIGDLNKSLDYGVDLRNELRAGIGLLKNNIIQDARERAKKSAGYDSINKDLESALASITKKSSGIFPMDSLNTITGINLEEFIRRGYSGSATELDSFLGSSISDYIQKNLGRSIISKMFSNYPEKTSISSFFNSLLSPREIKDINLSGYVVGGLVNSVKTYGRADALGSNPYGDRGNGLGGMSKVSLDALLNGDTRDDGESFNYGNEENLEYQDYLNSDLESAVNVDSGFTPAEMDIVDEEKTRDNISNSIDRMVNKFKGMLKGLSDDEKVLDESFNQGLVKLVGKDTLDTLFKSRKSKEEIRELRGALYDSLGKSGLSAFFKTNAKLDRIIGKSNFREFESEILSKRDRFVKTSPSYVILRYFVYPFVRYWADGVNSPVDAVKTELSNELLSGSYLNDLHRFASQIKKESKDTKLPETIFENISSLVEKSIDSTYEDILNFDGFMKYVDKNVFNRNTFLSAITILAVPSSEKIHLKFGKMYYVGDTESAKALEAVKNPIEMQILMDKAGNSEELGSKIHGSPQTVIIPLDFSRGFKLDSSNPIYHSVLLTLRGQKRLAALTNVVKPLFNNYMKSFVRGMSSYIDKDMTSKYLLDTFLHLNYNTESELDSESEVLDDSGSNSKTRRKTLVESEMHAWLVEMYHNVRLTNPKKYNSKTIQARIDSYLSQIKRHLSSSMPDEVFNTINFDNIAEYINSRDKSRVVSFLLRKDRELTDFEREYNEYRSGLESRMSEQDIDVYSEKSRVDTFYSDFITIFKKPILKSVKSLSMKHPLVERLALLEPSFNKTKALVDKSTFEKVNLGSQSYKALNKKIVDISKSLKDLDQSSPEFQSLNRDRQKVYVSMSRFFSNLNESLSGKLFGNPNNLQNINDHLGGDHLDSVLIKAHNFFDAVKTLEKSPSFPVNVRSSIKHLQGVLASVTTGIAELENANKFAKDNSFDIQEMMSATEIAEDSASVYEGVSLDLRSMVVGSGFSYDLKDIGLTLLPKYIINGKEFSSDDYIDSFNRIFTNMLGKLKVSQTVVLRLRKDGSADSSERDNLLEINRESQRDIEANWAVLEKMIRSADSMNLRRYLLALVGSSIERSETSAVKFKGRLEEMISGVRSLKSNIDKRRNDDLKGKTLDEIKEVLSSEYNQSLATLSSKKELLEKIHSNCENLSGFINGINIEKQKNSDGKISRPALQSSFDFYSNFLSRYEDMTKHPVYNRTYTLDDGTETTLKEVYENNFLSGAAHTLYRMFASGMIRNAVDNFLTSCDKYVSSGFKDHMGMIKSSSELDSLIVKMKSYVKSIFPYVLKRSESLKDSEYREIVVYDTILKNVLGGIPKDVSLIASGRGDIYVENEYRDIVSDKLVELFNLMRVEEKLGQIEDKGIPMSERGVYDMYDRVVLDLNDRFGPVISSFGSLTQAVGLTDKSNPYSIVLGIPALKKIMTFIERDDYTNAYTLYNASRKLISGLRERESIENMFRQHLSSMFEQYGFTPDDLLSVKFEIIVRDKTRLNSLDKKISSLKSKIESLGSTIDGISSLGSVTITKDEAIRVGIPTSLFKGLGDNISISVVQGYMNTLVDSLKLLVKTRDDVQSQVSRVEREYKQGIKTTPEKVAEFAGIFNNYGMMIQEFAPDHVVRFFGLDKSGIKKGSEIRMREALDKLQKTLVDKTV